MNAKDELLSHAPYIQERIGYHFKNSDLLVLPFVHRSFVNENKQITDHNERLEFLGDSVLGLLIADFLYSQKPELSEGELSYLRSRLVEASSCVTYVSKLEISAFLLLGKGERANDGRGRESILADFFEALIGAIYLDGGLEASREFIFKNFNEEIQRILKTPFRNWKAVLQDYCQKNFQKTPLYTVLDEVGPDHSKIFTIAVSLQGKELGIGKGPSKKEAQQAAASNAVLKLSIQQENQNGKN